MRKTIRSLAAILLVLAMAVPALAGNGAGIYYDAAMSVLFDTQNVTLKGEANFALDDVWFKTATGTYIQDSDRSFWQLDLSSPKADGSRRENGYTVIANGSKVYVMEVFHPGVYRTGTTEARNTVLRRSVELEQVVRFGRMLAEQADSLPGVTVTAVSDYETRIEIGPDSGELVSFALSMFSTFTARRYFGYDYDRIAPQDTAPLASYLTVTEGILASTRRVTPGWITITLKRDNGGNLEEVTGEMSLKLETAKDGIHTMDVNFRINVLDRGCSKVAPFDAKEFGVTLATDALDVDTYMTEIDEPTRLEALDTAWGFLGKAGYEKDPEMGDEVSQWRGQTYVNLESTDAATRLFCFWDAEGRLLGVHNLFNEWQGFTAEYTFDESRADPEMKKTIDEAEEKLMAFLREVNPEAASRITDLKVEWWYEKDGAIYLEFQEEPLDQENDGVMFVVRVAPEWRIEYYSCVSNG